MSYGIEIRNKDSNVIIDEQRKSFFVRGTATSVTGNPTLGNSGGASDIPGSGVGGSGQILRSDLNFFRPAAANSYTSTTYYSLEQRKVKGSNIDRILRNIVGGTSQYQNNRTNFTGTMVTAVDSFQLAPANSNGYTIPVTTDGTYGLEIRDAQGDVSFTTTDLNQYYKIDSVLSWGSSGSYTASGETWSYKATFTAPSGENIYDYYILSNNMNISITGTNFGTKAEYRGSSRTIDFYASSNREQIPIVARLIEP